MADIKMTYESLNSAAKKITQAKEELETLIKNLTNVVETLGSDYVGVSYDAFKNAWAESRPTMERLKEAVGEFGPALTQTAEEQREQELKQGQKMSKLGIN